MSTHVLVETQWKGFTIITVKIIRIGWSTVYKKILLKGLKILLSCLINFLKTP